LCRARRWLAIAGGVTCSTPNDMWERAVPGSRAQGTAQDRWATIWNAPDSVELLVEGHLIVAGLPVATRNPTRGLLFMSEGCRGHKATLAFRFAGASSSWTVRSNRPSWRVREFASANLYSDPRPRTSEMDEGSLKRRRRAVLWTIRAAGTEGRFGEGAGGGNPEGVVARLEVRTESTNKAIGSKDESSLCRFERTAGRRVRNLVEPRSLEGATPKEVAAKPRDAPISTGDSC
jgi:hypothetical protein